MNADLTLIAPADDAPFDAGYLDTLLAAIQAGVTSNTAEAKLAALIAFKQFTKYSALLDLFVVGASQYYEEHSNSKGVCKYAGAKLTPYKGHTSYEYPRKVIKLAQKLADAKSAARASGTAVPTVTPGRFPFKVSV